MLFHCAVSVCVRVHACAHEKFKIVQEIWRCLICFSCEHVLTIQNELLTMRTWQMALLYTKYYYSCELQFLPFNCIVCLPFKYTVCFSHIFKWVSFRLSYVYGQAIIRNNVWRVLIFEIVNSFSSITFLNSL